MKIDFDNRTTISTFPVFLNNDVHGFVAKYAVENHLAMATAAQQLFEIGIMHAVESAEVAA